MLTAADVTVLALRAAAIVAVLQAAGMALFLGLLGEGLDRSDRRLRRATGAAAAAAGLLVLLQHAAEPARMAATFAGVWDWTLQQALLESNAGAAHGLRLFGLILIAWSAARGRRIGRRMGLVGAIVTLASFLLTGHTAADEQRWLLVVLLLAHVAIAAFWFGALLALGIASTHESLAATGEVVRRFSTIAVRLVPLIPAAGIAMAVFLLPDLAALTSPYGTLLIAKLAGFGGLMALAAWNKVLLGPAIARGSAAALGTFRHVVAAEWLVLAAILVVTSVMTGLFGPD